MRRPDKSILGYRKQFRTSGEYITLPRYRPLLFSKSIFSYISICSIHRDCCHRQNAKRRRSFITRQLSPVSRLKQEGKCQKRIDGKPCEGRAREKSTEPWNLIRIGEMNEIRHSESCAKAPVKLYLRMLRCCGIRFICWCIFSRYCTFRGPIRQFHRHPTRLTEQFASFSPLFLSLFRWPTSKNIAGIFPSCARFIILTRYLSSFSCVVCCV